MSLPSRVQDILDTIGQAAAEVPCPVEDCREFVAVSKARTSSIPNFECRFPYFAKDEWIYHVYRFRVRSELIEQDANVSPDDLRDYQKIYLVDEKMVTQVLSMWLGNPELLGRPAECDIPI